MKDSMTVLAMTTLVPVDFEAREPDIEPTRQRRSADIKKS
jgi:hypothetical protein